MIDEGKIDTWSYDEDGDFTHTGQWRNKAWMSSFCTDDELVFYIIGRKNIQMEVIEYAVFHGRFVELLLNHFPKEIPCLEVTSPLDSPFDYNSINL